MRECFVRGRLLRNALRGWMFHAGMFCKGTFDEKCIKRMDVS